MNDLKNEKITVEEIEEIEEIEEFEAMEEVMKEDRAEFHQEILEWMTSEQIQHQLCNFAIDEIDTEEAYVAKNNVFYEYLMER